MLETAIRPDLPSRWPAVVRAEVQRRHGVMRDRAVGGEILDLGSSGARDRLAAGELAGSVDSVVSACGLVHFADLPGALEALAQALAPGGELLAVEPVGRPGMRGMLLGTLGARLGPVGDVHLGRDLSAALREGGWSVTDLERFVMPTSIWPLRPFVALRAIRIGDPK